MRINSGSKEKRLANLKKKKNSEEKKAMGGADFSPLIEEILLR